MPTPKQQYTAELNAISDRYASLEDVTIKRMLTMLKQLRRDIAAEVATTDFGEFRLAQFEAAIERQIAAFQQGLTTEVRGTFGQTYQAGAEMVAMPFQAIGVDVGWFSPSQAQLNVVMDFSAKLIQDISDEIRSGVDKSVRRAVVGEMSTIDAMKDITRVLGIEARAGVWKKIPDPVKGIAARAETDLRTEMGRAFNLATFSQQQEAAARIPGLTKSWTATGDVRTRPTHLRAHMKYKNRPIPIRDKFQVGSARLRYPLDPAGPPEETINCRCRTVTHHPAVGRVGSNLDGRIAAELKRRGEK